MANSSFTKGTIETPVSPEHGGTGLSALGTADQVFKMNSGGTAAEWGDQASGSKFGGDGSDGALSVTSGTTNIDAAGANVVIKNYTSISISSGATLSVTNPATSGTILILKSSGNVTIEGTIDIVGVGSLGGTNGYEIWDSSTHYGGVGGAGGNGAATSGAGGTAGAAGTPGAAFDTVAEKYYPTADSSRLYRRSVIIACGSGGGAGGAGGYGFGNTTNGAGGAGGAGGRGGGGLIIECAGALDFDAGGEIDISGDDGAIGGTGQVHAYVNTFSYCSGSGGGGGGGGGGAAGMALIIYNTLTDNSGTVTALGGAGGAGGGGSTTTDSDGGQDGAGGGSGASGCGAGNYNSLVGRTGPAGQIGGIRGATGVNGTAGTATTTAAGASGGSGGSGAGSVSNSTRASGTGGNGGAASGTSDSNLYLIVQNNWF